MPLLAWQGISLSIPPRWSPVKLDGDWKNGYALMADLHRPRLGIRWQTPRQRGLDAAARVLSVLREEVGTLAAAEAEPWQPAPPWESGLLYLDLEPPGRDVWVAYSPMSRRIVTVVHHAHRRERLLREALLPKLRDESDAANVPWSAFDLSCRAPKEFVLLDRQLNAGDLTLSFKAKRQSLLVRQIAVAELALQRRTLAQWLSSQQRALSRTHRAVGECEPITVAGLTGVRRRMRRRRRMFFVRALPAEIITLALHDQPRDRLVIVQASREDLACEVAGSVGFASRFEEENDAVRQIQAAG